MPTQVHPHDSDSDRDEERDHKKKNRDKDKEKKHHRHHDKHHRDKDKDSEEDHSPSRRSKDKDKERHKDRGKSYHRSSSSKYKEKESSREHRSYHRSSSSSSRHKDKDKDRDKSRHKSKEKDKHKDDLILEEIDGDDERSDVDDKVARDIRAGRSSTTKKTPVPALKIDTKVEEKGQNGVENDDDGKLSKMLAQSPRVTPMSKMRHANGTVHFGNAIDEEDDTRINIFFKEAKAGDRLGDYLPANGDPVVESVSEILFKPYPLQLKIFAVFICISQFLTLVSLFYSLLPCPDEKPSWLVFIGVPLCCAYAGIESIHHMLRYIHLGKGYRFKVFLMIVNCLMQLLCVGVVMGKSENLLSLIGNFVGVAIVLQIDEFLASYIPIKDIDPTLLEKKSWRTKMMLESKMWLICVAAIIVYLVTIACWRFDSLYCASYDIEGNINDVDNNVDNPV